eukprot:2887567-Rhodomonas_salina.2
MTAYASKRREAIYHKTVRQGQRSKGKDLLWTRSAHKVNCQLSTVKGQRSKAETSSMTFLASLMSVEPEV